MRSRLSLGALAALSFLAVVPVEAQSPVRPQFGALGGVSSSSITDTKVTGLAEVPGIRIDSRRHVGFQLGAYYTHSLAGALSIQPEIHYIQKGLRLQFRDIDSGSGSEPRGSIDVRPAYLELPVLLRYDVARVGSIRPFLVTGPSVAFRVGCRFLVKSGALSSDQTCNPDMGNTTAEDEDPIKKFDAGGIVGAGVQGMFGGRALSAQVRYSRGFVTVAKDAGNAAPKNTGISVLFGIGF